MKTRNLHPTTTRWAAPALALGALAMTAAPAHAVPEPMVHSISSELVDAVREEARNAPHRPLHEVEVSRDEVDEVFEQPADSESRAMLPADNDAAHYARGSTLVVHVFVDHAAGTWTAADREVAYARSQVAKEYYVDNAPAAANVSFNTSNVSYSTWVSGTITNITDAQINEALANIGFVDSDSDGIFTDDVTFFLQEWGGSWDNVLLCMNPYSNARAYAYYAISLTELYLNSGPSTWIHEWGHLFGACDEYVENGTCNGGLNCGPCQSWFLVETVNNQNCDLGACGTTVDCMMKNLTGLCEYTHRNWGWVDDDGNGLVNEALRLDGSTIYELYHNGFFSWNNTDEGQLTAQRWPSWSVTALRSPASADYDIAVYGDFNHANLRAATATARKVEFVVGDYNHTNLGNEHVQVSRFSGSTDYYNLTYESGSEMFFPDGQARTVNWPAPNVANVWDVPLFAGETIGFSLSEMTGTVDFAMALFKSSGGTYFVDQWGSEWERNANGIGIGEYYVYTVPEDDVYGLVVWSENAAAGQFTMRIGPAPLTLAEEAPYSINWDLGLYNYTPNAFYWAFAGTRPDAGTDVTLTLSDDSTYETIAERSSSYPSGNVEFIASDYFNGYSNDYLRVSRTSGTGPYTTNWEHDPEILDGRTAGMWTSPLVGKIWDVWMGADQPYFLRQYNDSGALNAGIYIFSSLDGDIRKARHQFEVAYNFRAPSSGGEWGTHTPTSDGWYGYVMINNNTSSGTYTLMHGPKTTLDQSVPETWYATTVFGEVPISTPYWQVIGARPSDSDRVEIGLWGCESYGVECYLGYDAGGAGVRFIASDHLHAPLETLYPRVIRSSGAGPFDLSHEAGNEEIVFVGDPLYTPETAWTQREVVQVWDLWVPGGEPGGQDVTIAVRPSSGDLDLGLALFSSNGTTVYQPRYGAVAEADASGAGGDEVLTINLTADDWYGVVVFSNTDDGGSYRVHVWDPSTVQTPDAAAVAPFGLLASSANPLSGPVALELSLEEAGRADVAIYDVQGRLVRQLLGEHREAGMHRVTWDGRDAAGRTLSAGVYLAQLTSGTHRASVKLVQAR